METRKKELRLKRVNHPQLVLRAVDVEKLIEPEHPARAKGELVEGLDRSVFRAVTHRPSKLKPSRPSTESCKI